MIVHRDIKGKWSRKLEKGQGWILIGFVTGKHSHLEMLFSMGSYSSSCCNRRGVKTTDSFIFIPVDISSFGHSSSAERAWKNVLFSTPLWDILGFVLVKLAVLKMLSTGRKGFALAAHSFGSYWVVKRRPRKRGIYCLVGEKDSRSHRTRQGSMKSTCGCDLSTQKGSARVMYGVFISPQNISVFAVKKRDLSLAPHALPHSLRTSWKFLWIYLQRLELSENLLSYVQETCRQWKKQLGAVKSKGYSLSLQVSSFAACQFFGGGGGWVASGAH